ncbi:MAG: hypothetical protein K2Q97_18880 [Burkholderiaceae bacterium]|nr:hypothetical protein [Burkholderiaceae bacterium]
MLDLSFQQAAGLQSFMPRTDLRVLAVASQSNTTDGIETIWQMCASLQRLGYPVVVLDGTAQETENSPGLFHLMQQAPWNEGATMNAGTSSSSLAVIPANSGLQQLGRQAGSSYTPPLDRLLAYFRSYGVLVLHAPAPVLGPLLTHTDTMPLVLMGRGAAGVLSSYKTLKQIATHTGLHCMVAALLRGHSAAERARAHADLETLQSCAQRHLGGMIQTTTIATQSPQDLQRLALQLLENAGTISGVQTSLLSGHPAVDPTYFVRRH